MRVESRPMRYFLHDHTMDITCSVDELFTMHERGLAIYGMLPPTGDPPRVLRPYIAERPRYRYDPLLATVEDFNLPAADGSGELTVTVTRDPLRRCGPRVTGADRDGQLTLGFGAHGRDR
jgi:hypothetical protein